MSEQRPPAHPPSAPPSRKPAQDEPWAELRRFTAARIALPRSGASLATAPLLEFRLAHARARDAVHAPFDDARLCAELAPLGLPVLTVASAAQDRQHYLMRPDLGRRLADDSAAMLAAHAGSGYDVAFIVADGLSARAVAAHAQPLLAQVLPRLADWRIAPLVVARLGRVALGDAVANALHAEIAVMLIGERPGLSAPDSMGAYLTFGTHAANQRCRAQLHLQHPAGGPSLSRCRDEARASHPRHARAPALGRAAQGRRRPAADRGAVKQPVGPNRFDRSFPIHRSSFRVPSGSEGARNP